MGRSKEKLPISFQMEYHVLKIGKSKTGRKIWDKVLRNRFGL